MLYIYMSSIFTDLSWGTCDTVIQEHPSKVVKYKANILSQEVKGMKILQLSLHNK